MSRFTMKFDTSEALRMRIPELGQEEHSGPRPRTANRDLSHSRDMSEDCSGRGGHVLRTSDQWVEEGRKTPRVWVARPLQ